MQTVDLNLDIQYKYSSMDSCWRQRTYYALPAGSHVHRSSRYRKRDLNELLEGWSAK